MGQTAEPSKRKLQDDTYVRMVYFRVIFLALFAHASYVIIFGLVSYWGMVHYNIASVLFYLVMFIVAAKGYYRTAVTLVHAEVCLFVVCCTILGSWNLGFYLYLIAVATLVYFCPYDHKFIPYLFSIVEICIFLSLHYFSSAWGAYYPPTSDTVNMLIYIYNAVAGFFIILYAAFVSNVSASVTKRRLEDENRSLNAMASHDQMTGLLNRHSFLKKLDEHESGIYVLAIGDIDNFKQINDTYGHSGGDYVLKTIAGLMRSTCAERANICRWGGEEFLILFPYLQMDEAVMLVQNLRAEIAAYNFHYENVSFQVTITFGIAETEPDEDFSGLLKRTDARLYSGKAHGKNQVVSKDEETAHSK